MAKGDVHTSFDGDSEKWVDRREGNQRASSTHDTAAEASERGKDLARSTGNEWVKHRRDNGRIHDRNTYGDDPKPPKG